MDRKCARCEKAYSTEGNLRKHIKSKHPNEQSMIPRKYKDEGNFQYSCPCGKNFNHKHHFLYHLKSHNDGSLRATTIHPGLTTMMRVKKKCPMCPYADYYITSLMEHFERTHGIEIVEQMLEFSSEYLFDDWKSETEKKTISNFVKKYTKKSSKGITTIFACNRSGNYVPKTTVRRRMLKIQGTNKINAFCPASMKLFADYEGKCCVKYIETHIGHTNELGHVTLSSSDRTQIAEKIALKIPFEDILDEVRDSIANSTLDRTHLLTKKDLYNIEQGFNLRADSIRRPKDSVSVDSWIHEFMEKDDVYVFYKSQEMVYTKHSQLKLDDFMLVIMSHPQRDILLKHGSDVICIDGTHGMKNSDLDLLTLLVRDDLGQVFPGAFCITSRTDKQALEICFSYIRKWTCKICPNIFMSDLDDAFYNAWTEVMEKPRLRLYCGWHVDRAWRTNLKKIQNRDTQILIYKELRTLLEERDQVAFLPKLNEFYQKISTQSDTKEFGKYFLDHYMKNYELWVYSHGLNSDVNTNMRLERMHAVFKHIYLKGNTVRRLDQVISALMQFTKDKLYDRLITINKGKINSKLKDIRSRHKASIGLDANLLTRTDEGWTLKSSSSNDSEVHFINEVDSDCNCQLRCNYCDTCIHSYSCTCMESAVKWIMCKHIHFVCTLLKEVRNEQHIVIFVDGSDDSIDESEQHNELQMDVNLTCPETPLPQEKDPKISDVKEKILSKFLKMAGKSNS